MSRYRDGRVPRKLQSIDFEFDEAKRRMGRDAYLPTFTVQVPGFEPEWFLASEAFARKVWQSHQRDEAAVESWWNGLTQIKRNEALKALEISGLRQVKRQGWNELQEWVRQELLRLKRQEDRPFFAVHLAMRALHRV